MKISEDILKTFNLETRVETVLCVIALEVMIR